MLNAGQKREYGLSQWNQKEILDLDILLEEVNADFREVQETYGAPVTLDSARAEPP